MLPENEPGTAGDEVRSQACSSAPGEHVMEVWTATAQPASSYQAKDALRVASQVGRRLEKALKYMGRIKTTVLFEELEAFAPETKQVHEKTVKTKVERPTSGVAMFTDDWRAGAAGFAVTS